MSERTAQPGDMYARWLERTRRRATLEAHEQEAALERVTEEMATRLARLELAQAAGAQREALARRVAELRRRREELNAILAGRARGLAQRRLRESEALLERCRALAAAADHAQDLAQLDGLSRQLALDPPLARRTLAEIRALADSGPVHAWRARTASLLEAAARRAGPNGAAVPAAPASADATRIAAPSGTRTGDLEQHLARDRGVAGEVLRGLRELSVAQLEELLDAFLARRTADAGTEAAWQLPADPFAEVTGS